MMDVKAGGDKEIDRDVLPLVAFQLQQVLVAMAVAFADVV